MDVTSILSEILSECRKLNAPFLPFPDGDFAAGTHLWASLLSIDETTFRKTWMKNHGIPYRSAGNYRLVRATDIWSRLPWVDGAEIENGETA